MLNVQLITDLRKLLNEAQDYAQEAKVNVKRAVKNPPDWEHFEAEAAFFTRTAIRRARTFIEVQKEVADALAND